MTKRRFSLKKKVQEFELEMPDGDIREAKIEEFDGLARDKYLNVVTKKMGSDETGVMRDHTNMFADLLAMCLYVQNKDKEYVLLSLEEIQRFPNAMQSELFEIASEINALAPAKKKEGEDEKNV